jgi:hypothetical protein
VTFEFGSVDPVVEKVSPAPGWGSGMGWGEGEQGDVVKKMKTSSFMLLKCCCAVANNRNVYLGSVVCPVCVWKNDRAC